MSPAGRARVLAVLPVVAIVGLGAWLRYVPAATAFLFGDELHSLATRRLRYSALLGAYDSVGSGLALPLLQRLCDDALGGGLLALRAPALVPGILLLALLPWLGRRLAPDHGRAFALALLAVSPFHVFYSHFARSYALVALLALGLVAAATRLLAVERPPASAYLAFAATGALLPWAHLTSLPFVAAIAGVTLLALSTGSERARRPLALLATAGASLGAALLYAPALHRVAGFVVRKTEEEYAGSFSALDVTALLAGGRAAALVGVPLLGFAAYRALRQRGRAALPLVAAALLPVPLVLLARPYGDAYAYARYAIAALPAITLLLGDLIAQAFDRLRGAGRLAPWAALLLALGLHAVHGRRADGPYANTYLSMYPLPAFDVPYPALPAVYRTLPAGASIVEAPALLNRSRQLYRSYFLQHRHPTRLGFLPEEGAAPPGPHVAVTPAALAGAADFLVLHLAVEPEVERYWRFVFEDAWPRAGGARALMERQAVYGRPLPVPEPGLVLKLRRRFGEPSYEDASHVVFRLR